MADRWKQHIHDSHKVRNEKRPLYDAFEKYGIDNFKMTLVEDGLTDDEACIREQYWINYYRSYIGFDNCNGYNATLGGDSRRRYDYAEIAEKYLEFGLLKHTADFFNCDIDTVRNACREYGIPILYNRGEKLIHCIETDEYFNSISEAGRVIYPENSNAGRANISRAIRNNGIAYGKHWEYVEDLT